MNLSYPTYFDIDETKYKPTVIPLILSREVVLKHGQYFAKGLWRGVVLGNGVVLEVIVYSFRRGGEFNRKYTQNSVHICKRRLFVLIFHTGRHVRR